MYITNEDVIGLNQFAIKTAAQCVGINHHFISPLETFDLIEKVDAVTFLRLDTFIVHYRQWHNFHVYLEHNNNSGSLDWMRTDLDRLISQRDDSRSALIARLREIGYNPM
jgi:hypothetical protein